MSNRKIAKIAVSAATYWVDRPYDYIAPDELQDKVEPGVRVTVPFARGNRRCEGIVLAVSAESKFNKLKPISSVLDNEPVLTPDQIKLALWMRERFFCTVYGAVRTMLPAGLWYDLCVSYKLAVSLETAMDFAEQSKPYAEAVKAVSARGGVCQETEIDALLGHDQSRRALSALVSSGILERVDTEKRRVKDKTSSMVSLSIPAEEAAAVIRQKRRATLQAAVLELLADVGQASATDIRAFTGAQMPVIRKLEQEGCVSIETWEEFRKPDFETAERADLPALTPEQQSAYDGIISLAGGAKAALLFGVTGSGKTSVYVRVIDEMLKRGKGSILLVPEIALTPQMLYTFSSYFAGNIAVLHSSLSIGERYDEWKRVRSGLAKVVIGTRSAVFAPVHNLGVIIIDEEQESSYKSDNTPRYHARDVAKYRCARSGALMLLGSATPDITSRYYAETGVYEYFSIPTRFNRMAMPEVRIVDMKRELRQGNGGNISAVLSDEIKLNLENSEQSILFLNRRGESKLVTCVDCGYIYVCPHCSVSMTYHKSGDRLMCHYCGYVQRLDDKCPECGGSLSRIGAGTQKVYGELSDLFPNVEILRMDADTVGAAGSHDALLSRFRDRRIPIMIGTQMVTKGLNFENVTLVGVISADQSLYAGDYRSGERTFSLITQVVGRSGRGERPGRAVIQTFTPDNQTIRQASAQDYESFYRTEIELRRFQKSPPFAELIALTASGLDETVVRSCCTDIRDELLRGMSDREGARVLGPAPLNVVRVKNRYRYRVTLACRNEKYVRELIAHVVSKYNTDPRFKGVSVFADTNPSD